MGYIKQLDALRGIAIILVLVSHWLPQTYLINRLPNGALGVDIFFVLSGFLITRILLEQRNKAEVFDLPVTDLIRIFYMKRMLRIFPIYYLTILVLFLFSESTETSIGTSVAYYATHTANFYLFSIEGWDGMVSHLWSLSVEEQFYLIWPWIILFLKKEYLIYVISIFILIGVWSQYALITISKSNILTITCFDAFGMGAFLSWIVTYAQDRVYQFCRVVLILGLMATLLLLHGAAQGYWDILPLRTLNSLIALCIIAWIVFYHEYRSSGLKLIPDNGFLVFIGKISYGIYLYHGIVASLTYRLMNKYLLPLISYQWYERYHLFIFWLIGFTLLCTLSWFSYVFIEKRFLNLKRLLSYRYQEAHNRSFPGR